MTTFHMPAVPQVDLPRMEYVSWNGYNMRIGAFQVTGTENIANALDAFATYISKTNACGDVAMDIETKGTDSDKWWKITCVTAAFYTDAGMVSVLFDPLRQPEHRKLMRRLLDLASRVVYHNSVFDIPPLVAHEILTLDDVNKVWDTLVLAKMINTSDRAGRSLEDLSVRYGITPDDGIKIQQVFSASGHGSASEGFAQVDVRSGTYRDGAMSDTVVTLRLLHILEQLVTRTLTKGSNGAILEAEGAYKLVCDMQRNNQITLRRAARGYKIDREFPDKFERDNLAEVTEAKNILTAAGLEPGRGDKLVAHLGGIGQLPPNWPTTPKGALSADKKAMELLTSHGHPLAKAHLTVAEYTKVHGYLTKVVDQARATGRLHPGIGVLGASATGRMCLPDTHKLVTKRGIMSPDEIEIGDETLSQDRTWTKVTAVHRYENAEINVWENSSARLEFTTEHRWVVVDNNGNTTVSTLDDSPQTVLLNPYPVPEKRHEPINSEERLAERVGIDIYNGSAVDVGVEWALSLSRESAAILVRKAACLILPEDKNSRDIIRVARHLCGDRTLVDDYGQTIWAGPTAITSQMRKSTSWSDVWCVSTEDGTFTAWSDFNGPYLTGNSVTGIELQQFPGNARGILIADEEPGWSSVDWSSIEPVTMAVCAGDIDFLTPFYNGGDLYIPIARAAGLIPPDVDDKSAEKHPGRKVSKVVLLAAMYGQGKTSLAANLTRALGRDVTPDEAGELRLKIQAAMPTTFAFMKNLERHAEAAGVVTTVMGRVLVEDAGFAYRAVNHFCITPETPILTADLRHVRADSVKAGDKLVGFDEFEDTCEERFFRTAVVKNAHTLTKPSVRVHTDDGKYTDCSTDHRWLVSVYGGTEFTWVSAEDLSVGVHTLITPTELETFEGADLDWYIENKPTVTAVEPLGDVEVVAIETSTHTFIANGYLSHNCQGSAADILYESTLRLDRMGLADHVHLWMHDELVVDTAVEAEVNAAMQTPPDSLMGWARVNEVKLRTDAQPMGMDWKAV